MCQGKSKNPHKSTKNKTKINNRCIPKSNLIFFLVNSSINLQSCLSVSEKY